MGLDVYVGTLSRYYTFRWELMAERWARDNGEKIQIVGRPQPTPLRPAQKLILMWRSALERVLGSGITLDWPEDSQTPYATHKLDRLGHLGVRLLAWSHLTQQSLPLQFPEDGLPTGDVWDLNPSCFPLLFSTAKLFLPGLPRKSIVMIDPTGNESIIASVDHLATELRELNLHTLRLVIPTIEPGPSLGKNSSATKIPPALTLYDADPHVDWFQNSRSTLSVVTYGLQVFSSLANYAVEQRLPLVLDS